MQTQEINVLAGREARSELLAKFAAAVAPEFVGSAKSSGAYLPSRDGSTEASIANEVYALATAMLETHMRTLCNYLPFHGEPAPRAVESIAKVHVEPGDVLVLSGSDMVQLYGAKAELDASLPEDVLTVCLPEGSRLQVVSGPEAQVTLKDEAFELLARHLLKDGNGATKAEA